MQSRWLVEELVQRVGHPSAFGDIFVDAQHSMGLTGRIGQWHFGGVDPEAGAIGGLQRLDDMQLRLVAFQHLPVGGAVSFGLCARPGQVEVGLADDLGRVVQTRGNGKHLVAAEIAAFAILPENRLGDGVQDQIEGGATCAQRRFPARLCHQFSLQCPNLLDQRRIRLRLNHPIGGPDFGHRTDLDDQFRRVERAGKETIDAGVQGSATIGGGGVRGSKQEHRDAGQPGVGLEAPAEIAARTCIFGSAKQDHIRVCGGRLRDAIVIGGPSQKRCAGQGSMYSLLQ